MKIKTITVRSAMKISRDYNTVDADVTLTVELNETDEITEVHDVLSDLVHSMVQEDVETSLRDFDNIS